MVWISGSMVTHGAAPSPSFLGSPCMLASWFVTTRVVTSSRNKIEWSSRTNTPFKQGHLPPPESTLVCKVCKVLPICVNFCSGRIYYILGKGDISRVCIHLGMHNHPISDGICRETLDTISGLIAQEVSKTPTAKNFAIAMAASKEFLDKYLIHNGSGPKKMLRG
jgi:hypothetical protein